MDFATVVKIVVLALPIVKDITGYIKNKSEEKAIEKSIALEVLKQQKEELIDPLYIVEE